MAKKIHLVTIKEDYRGRQAAFIDDIENGVNILSPSGVNYGGVYDNTDSGTLQRKWRPYTIKKIYIFKTKKEQEQVFKDFNNTFRSNHQSIWQD